MNTPMQENTNLSSLAPKTTEGGFGTTPKQGVESAFPTNSLAPETPAPENKPQTFGGAALSLNPNPNMSADIPKADSAIGKQPQYSKAIQSMLNAAKQRAKQPADMGNLPNMQTPAHKIEGAIDATKPMATEQLKADTALKSNPLAAPLEPKPNSPKGAYAQSLGMVKSPNGRATVKFDDYDVDLGDVDLNDDDAVRRAYTSMEENHKAMAGFYNDDIDSDNDDLSIFA